MEIRTARTIPSGRKIHLIYITTDLTNAEEAICVYLEKWNLRNFAVLNKVEILKFSIVINEYFSEHVEENNMGGCSAVTDSGISIWSHELLISFLFLTRFVIDPPLNLDEWESPNLGIIYDSFNAPFSLG